MKTENPSIKRLANYTDNLNAMTKKELNHLAREMTWGTYGPKGDRQLVRKPLSKLSTPHIKNILITQLHVMPKMRKVFMHILERRNKKQK